MAKISLAEFLNSKFEFYENSYKITSPCIYKHKGKKIKAKIDMDNKILYNIDGQVIKKLH